MPRPTQESLDALLAVVTRFRVIGAGANQDKAFWGPVLVDSSAPEQLAALRYHLAISQNPPFFATCLCSGGPTFEVYENAALRAAISLHHGRSIRWIGWAHDALLAHPEALTRWMSDIGAGPERKRQEARRRWEGWHAATPRSLAAFHIELDRATGPFDIEAMLRAMRRECAGEDGCVRALFAWFGAADATWDWVSYYEEVTEKLLAAHRPDQLIAALEGAPLGDAEVAGAARYFGRTAGTDFARAVSPALRSRFLEAGLRTADPRRLARAQAVFAIRRS